MSNPSTNTKILDMVILGAGGHAKELLEILTESNPREKIALYDDITPVDKIPNIFSRFELLRSEIELENWFSSQDPHFFIGVGGIPAKEILYKKAIRNGGKAKTLIATNASIGNFDTKIGIGSCIMQFCFISNSVRIGNGVLVNTRANIHHDVNIDDFSEIAPGAILLGKSEIGKNVFIGAGAIILPGINIGNNCTIGAGSIVTKNVFQNLTVKGNPAR